MEEEVKRDEPRSGSLLQRIVANIFEKAGFSVSMNSGKFGFKADIIATKSSPEMTVIITCKGHSRLPLNIEGLIHEWDSKRKYANAQAALVVVEGVNLKSYFDYAKRVGVGLWDDNIIYGLITGQGKFDDFMRAFIQFDTASAMGGMARPKKGNLAVKILKRILIAAIIYTISLLAALAVYYVMNLQLLIMWLISCVLFIILIVLKGYFLPEI
ncbi:restriction endonuclease [Candidatus Pacearchaeota archaeon]|nr:restriction endonuclease [Candidatus Pacearchaeota archaeon]